jgi:ABC-type cobalamin/Fe3+-siderophores transport system ATPase subunit
MQKLIVRNFGAIQEAEIEVNRFLVLTGEQASGKSTIAKLIYFFQTLRNDFFDIVLEKTDAETSFEDYRISFINFIRDKFRQYFSPFIATSPNLYVEYVFTEENKISILENVRVEFASNFYHNIFQTTKRIITNIRRLPNPTTKYEQLRTEKERTRLFDELNNQINQLFDSFFPEEPLFSNDKILPNILYIPDNRNITVSYGEQFKGYFLNKQNFSNIEENFVSSFMYYVLGLKDWFSAQRQIENSFNDKNFQILKGNYKVQGDYEILELENGKSIALNFASSGQKEVIRILQDMMYQYHTQKSFFRVIEEPEAHLFPNAQLDLIQILTYVTNQNKGTLVITTHSPYITVIFNYLCYAAKIMSMAKEKGLENLVDEKFWNKPEFSFFDKNCVVEPQNFRAYAMKNGIAKNIFDEGDGLFEEDLLDVSFDKLSIIFEKLYALKGQILRYV